MSLLDVIGLSDFIGFIDCLSSIYRPSPRALDSVTEGRYESDVTIKGQLCTVSRISASFHLGEEEGKGEIKRMIFFFPFRVPSLLNMVFLNTMNIYM